MTDRYVWNPIENLPLDWSEMASEELRHLASIWTEQHTRLAGSEALRVFNERLSRQWAIETGIIEGLYTIDRGTTQLLIDRGIEASLIVHGSTDKPAEQVVDIVSVQQEALEGVFAFVATKRPLSNSYIRQLHQVMTRHQESVVGVDQFGNMVETDLIRGDWKKLPNNPMRPDSFIHEYCPPEHVAAEMDQLIIMHVEHTAENVPPEVEAAWLHHRFTQIHPFQDGNGRIARALASLVFLRARHFPLVVTRELRDEYVRALEEADRGDLGPLIEQFVRIQKRAFLSALSLSETVLKDYVPLTDVIGSAVDRLRARHESREEEKKKAIDLALSLKDLADSHFRQVASELNAQLHQVDAKYEAFFQSSSSDNDYYFKKQIVETAKHLSYFADTNTFRAWARLAIRLEQTTDVVVSFHSLGRQFAGICVVSAFLQVKQPDEDGVSIEEPTVLADEPFKITYFDDGSRLQERFHEWLSRIVLVGLDEWRRSL